MKIDRGIVWIYLFAILQFSDFANGRGFIETNFKNFENYEGKRLDGKCCEKKDFWSWARPGNREGCSDDCDHSFIICIGNATHSSSMSACEYGQKDIESVGGNKVSFNSHVGEETNPVRFPFQQWPGEVKLKIDVMDEDDDFILVDHYEYQYNTRDLRRKLDSPVEKLTLSGRNTKLNVNLRVFCDVNFFGTDCSIYCTETDDETGHYNCDPSTGEKICKPGWTGTDCLSNIDDCIGNRCYFGSTCVDGLNFYGCACPPGRTGVMCDAEVNECASQPCENGGHCLDASNAFLCECEPGYTGVYCEVELDECISYPCRNGGTCEDDIGAFSCLCPAGFTGPTCEIDEDECALNPCLQASKCYNVPGTYVCECLSGYTGRNCEADVNECNNRPCENGGLCINKVNGYACRCPDGFEGMNCEKEIDHCSPNYCRNGATCHSGKHAFTCECPLEFTGNVCSEDVDECHTDSFNCSSRGECINTYGSYECKCTDGYEGNNCELETDECLLETTPCANGGICVDGIGGFNCECQAGFTGSRCEVNTNECDSSPCLNNGTCVDEIDGFICLCDIGYIGAQCENQDMLTVQWPVISPSSASTFRTDSYTSTLKTKFPTSNASVTIDMDTSASTLNLTQTTTAASNISIDSPSIAPSSPFKPATTSTPIPVEMLNKTEDEVDIAGNFTAFYDKSLVKDLRTSPTAQSDYINLTSTKHPDSHTPDIITDLPRVNVSSPEYEAYGEEIDFNMTDDEFFQTSGDVYYDYNIFLGGLDSSKYVEQMSGQLDEPDKQKNISTMHFGSGDWDDSISEEMHNDILSGSSGEEGHKSVPIELLGEESGELFGSTYEFGEVHEEKFISESRGYGNIETVSGDELESSSENILKVNKLGESQDVFELENQISGISGDRHKLTEESSGDLHDILVERDYSGDYVEIIAVEADDIAGSGESGFITSNLTMHFGLSSKLSTEDGESGHMQDPVETGYDSGEPVNLSGESSGVSSGEAEAKDMTYAYLYPAIDTVNMIGESDASGEFIQVLEDKGRRYVPEISISDDRLQNSDDDYIYSSSSEMSGDISGETNVERQLLKTYADIDSIDSLAADSDQTKSKLDLESSGIQTISESGESWDEYLVTESAVTESGISDIFGEQIEGAASDTAENGSSFHLTVQTFTDIMSGELTETVSGETINVTNFESGNDYIFPPSLDISGDLSEDLSGEIGVEKMLKDTNTDIDRFNFQVADSDQSISELGLESSGIETIPRNYESWNENLLKETSFESGASGIVREQHEGIASGIHRLNFQLAENDQNESKLGLESSGTATIQGNDESWNENLLTETSFESGASSIVREQHEGIASGIDRLNFQLADNDKKESELGPESSDIETVSGNDESWNENLLTEISFESGASDIIPEQHEGLASGISDIDESMTDQTFTDTTSGELIELTSGSTVYVTYLESLKTPFKQDKYLEENLSIPFQERNGDLTGDMKVNLDITGEHSGEFSSDLVEDTGNVDATYNIPTENYNTGLLDTIPSTESSTETQEHFTVTTNKIPWEDDVTGTFRTEQLSSESGDSRDFSEFVGFSSRGENLFESSGVEEVDPVNKETIFGGEDMESELDTVNVSLPSLGDELGEYIIVTPYDMKNKLKLMNGDPESSSVLENELVLSASNNTYEESAEGSGETTEYNKVVLDGNNLNLIGKSSGTDLVDGDAIIIEDQDLGSGFIETGSGEHIIDRLSESRFLRPVIGNNGTFSSFAPVSSLDTQTIASEIFNRSSSIVVKDNSIPKPVNTSPSSTSFSVNPAYSRENFDGFIRTTPGFVFNYSSTMSMNVSSTKEIHQTTKPSLVAELQKRTLYDYRYHLTSPKTPYTSTENTTLDITTPNAKQQTDIFTEINPTDTALNKGQTRTSHSTTKLSKSQRISIADEDESGVEASSLKTTTPQIKERFQPTPSRKTLNNKCLFRNPSQIARCFPKFRIPARRPIFRTTKTLPVTDVNTISSKESMLSFGTLPARPKTTPTKDKLVKGSTTPLTIMPEASALPIGAKYVITTEDERSGYEIPTRNPSEDAQITLKELNTSASLSSSSLPTLTSSYQIPIIQNISTLVTTITNEAHEDTNTSTSKYSFLKDMSTKYIIGDPSSTVIDFQFTESTILEEELTLNASEVTFLQNKIIGEGTTETITTTSQSFAEDKSMMKYSTTHISPTFMPRYQIVSTTTAASIPSAVTKERISALFPSSLFLDASQNTTAADASQIPRNSTGPDDFLPRTAAVMHTDYLETAILSSQLVLPSAKVTFNFSDNVSETQQLQVANFTTEIHTSSIPLSTLPSRPQIQATRVSSLGDTTTTDITDNLTSIISDTVDELSIPSSTPTALCKSVVPSEVCKLPPPPLIIVPLLSNLESFYLSQSSKPTEETKIFSSLQHKESNTSQIIATTSQKLDTSQYSLVSMTLSSPLKQSETTVYTPDISYIPTESTHTITPNLGIAKSQRNLGQSLVDKLLHTSIHRSVDEKPILYLSDVDMAASSRSDIKPSTTIGFTEFTNFSPFTSTELPLMLSSIEPKLIGQQDNEIKDFIRPSIDETPFLKDVSQMAATVSPTSIQTAISLQRFTKDLNSSASSTIPKPANISSFKPSLSSVLFTSLRYTMGDDFSKNLVEDSNMIQESEEVFQTKSYSITDIAQKSMFYTDIKPSSTTDPQIQTSKLFVTQTSISSFYEGSELLISNETFLPSIVQNKDFTNSQLISPKTKATQKVTPATQVYVNFFTKILLPFTQKITPTRQTNPKAASTTIKRTTTNTTDIYLSETEKLHTTFNFEQEPLANNTLIDTLNHTESESYLIQKKIIADIQTTPNSTYSTHTIGIPATISTQATQLNYTISISSAQTSPSNYSASSAHTSDLNYKSSTPQTVKSNYSTASPQTTQSSFGAISPKTAKSNYSTSSPYTTQSNYSTSSPQTTQLNYRSTSPQTTQSNKSISSSQTTQYKQDAGGLPSAQLTYRTSSPQTTQSSYSTSGPQTTKLSYGTSNPQTTRFSYSNSSPRTTRLNYRSSSSQTTKPKYNISSQQITQSNNTTAIPQTTQSVYNVSSPQTTQSSYSARSPQTPEYRYKSSSPPTAQLIYTANSPQTTLSSYSIRSPQPTLSNESTSSPRTTRSNNSKRSPPTTQLKYGTSIPQTIQSSYSTSKPLTALSNYSPWATLSKYGTSLQTRQSNNRTSSPRKTLTSYSNSSLHPTLSNYSTNKPLKAKSSYTTSSQRTTPSNFSTSSTQTTKLNFKTRKLQPTNLNISTSSPQIIQSNYSTSTSQITLSNYSTSVLTTTHANFSTNTPMTHHSIYSTISPQTSLASSSTSSPNTIQSNYTISSPQIIPSNYSASSPQTSLSSGSTSSPQTTLFHFSRSSPQRTKSTYSTLTTSQRTTQPTYRTSKPQTTLSTDRTTKSNLQTTKKTYSTSSPLTTQSTSRISNSTSQTTKPTHSTYSPGIPQSPYSFSISSPQKTKSTFSTTSSKTTQSNFRKTSTSLQTSESIDSTSSTQTLQSINSSSIQQISESANSTVSPQISQLTDSSSRAQTVQISESTTVFYPQTTQPTYTTTTIRQQTRVYFNFFTRIMKPESVTKSSTTSTSTDMTVTKSEEIMASTATVNSSEPTTITRTSADSVQNSTSDQQQIAFSRKMHHNTTIKQTNKIKSTTAKVQTYSAIESSGSLSASQYDVFTGKIQSSPVTLNKTVHTPTMQSTLQSTAGIQLISNATVSYDRTGMAESPLKTKPSYSSVTSSNTDRYFDILHFTTSRKRTVTSTSKPAVSEMVQTGGDVVSSGMPSTSQNGITQKPVILINKTFSLTKKQSTTTPIVSSRSHPISNTIAPFSTVKRDQLRTTSLTTSGVTPSMTIWTKRYSNISNVNNATGIDSTNETSQNTFTASTPHSDLTDISIYTEKEPQHNDSLQSLELTNKNATQYNTSQSTLAGVDSSTLSPTTTTHLQELELLNKDGNTTIYQTLKPIFERLGPWLETFVELLTTESTPVTQRVETQNLTTAALKSSISKIEETLTIPTETTTLSTSMSRLLSRIEPTNINKTDRTKTDRAMKQTTLSTLDYSSSGKATDKLVTVPSLLVRKATGPRTNSTAKQRSMASKRTTLPVPPQTTYPKTPFGIIHTETLSNFSDAYLDTRLTTESNIGTQRIRLRLDSQRKVTRPSTEKFTTLMTTPAPTASRFIQATIKRSSIRHIIDLTSNNTYPDPRKEIYEYIHNKQLARGPAKLTLKQITVTVIRGAESLAEQGKQVVLRTYQRVKNISTSITVTVYKRSRQLFKTALERVEALWKYCETGINHYIVKPLLNARVFVKAKFESAYSRLSETFKRGRLIFESTVDNVGKEAEDYFESLANYYTDVYKQYSTEVRDIFASLQIPDS